MGTCSARPKSVGLGTGAERLRSSKLGACVSRGIGDDPWRLNVTLDGQMGKQTLDFKKVKFVQFQIYQNKNFDPTFLDRTIGPTLIKNWDNLTVCGVFKEIR